MKIARNEIERRVMKAMTREWASAKDLSERTGIPWRVCARALKRLAMRGEVSMDIRENVDYKYRVRKRPIYRVCATMSAVGPAWFMAAAGFVLEKNDGED
jgi:hypothetical protein